MRKHTNFLSNSIAVGLASMRLNARGGIAPVNMGANPATSLADVIVPDVFTAYVQQLTEQKSRLIQSGAVVRDAQIDALLAGGGVMFDMPSWNDLANDEDNISGDDADDKYVASQNKNSTPKKTTAAKEVCVRLSRNQSWMASDLAADLAGADPMNSIASRVADYWTRRHQAAFVATMNGVFAQDAKVTKDMSIDISAVTAAGGAVFSASAFIDALTTMGDSADKLKMVMVHSVVYARMQKNNLITFIPDARGEVVIPTFLTRQVIVDDGVPFDATKGTFETWLFGAGAVRAGVGSPKTPTETARLPDSGNGGGGEALYNRVEWVLHPTGYAVAVVANGGGPSNANTAGNLAHADTWKRVYKERKQIPMARLITKELTPATTTP